MPFADHIKTHYSLVVIIILLPLSLLYDIWFWVRQKIVFRLNSSPGKHKEKILSIQKQVQDSNGRGQLCFSTSSSTDDKSTKSSVPIKVSSLVDILEIDVDRRLVRCEPLVTMGQLMATLNKHGWTLPIVPELDHLTLGGLVS